MHGGSSESASRGMLSRRGRSPRNLNGTRRSSIPESGSKPNATFTSSLSIAVQGVSSSDGAGNSSASGSMATHAALPNGETKRAPRKSKTDALAALTLRSPSPTTGLDDSEPMDIDNSPLATPPAPAANSPIPVSSKLDMSSVKTSSPRNPPPRTVSRPFDLEDCPTFYPTHEEFRDPMAYIKSISDRARNSGICKVVPPMGWKMPFVTDTETFRFKTRVQRLNSIEASSRAKLNFLEALYRFHKQQGNPRVTVPTINHKPLDLWLLRKEVHKLGGYEAVNKGKKWADLGRLLGYGGIPGLSMQLRNSYVRVILPYEHFSDRVRNSPNNTPNATHDAKSAPIMGKTPPPGGQTNAVSADGVNDRSSPLSNSSSPLSEPPDDGEAKEVNGRTGSHRESSKERRKSSLLDTPARMNSLSLNSQPSAPSFKEETKNDVKQEQTCEVCNKKNRETEMLLCDGCDCGFHTFCLDPPLSVIPKGQWFCDTCLSVTGVDFGFDEGEEHSLSRFQARDLAFRKMWFESHPPTPSIPYADDDPTVNSIGSVKVSEFDVENEFWRLVQSPHETVEIEYGADVHSTTHGSAMPTLETHPLDPYSNDGWNLNNIPIVSDSLLRFIKSDISGMTVPWTYVGMVFSTFCWHNEDHYTYSINFMHWGETKTWYGIPGEDAEKFEAAIRREAPDLFESQPDLLFQLVTLMNPKRLTSAGVRVFACNQRAGEFVVTFPKAYHAGFNHGLNFNEAVNFALPDWLPFGRDCVQRYQEHRKHPVFSHDELLITITQQSQSIKTAIWLNDSLQEMTDREMAGRRLLRGFKIKEIVEARDTREDQYQCAICKSFCYLSQVVCVCPKAVAAKVACLDHAQLLCDCPMSQRTLRLRISDDELLNTQCMITSRAAVPGNWQAKLRRVLSESARPPLRSLRALLAEGDRINYPLPELPTLRKCVTRANEWVDTANSFTTRKQSRKRSRRSGFRGVAAAGDSTDDLTDRPERGLADLYALFTEVGRLGFDTPEIGLLKNLAAQAEEVKARAAVLLESVPTDGDRTVFLQDCEALIAHGSSLNVHLDELYQVEDIVLQEQLIKDLKDIDDSALTLDEVRHLLTRARACHLSGDNKYMKILEARLQAGNDWDQRAADVLAQPIKTIQDLDQFVEVETSIPVDPAVMIRIMTARAKALEFEKMAKSWLTPEPNAVLPRVSDALRLVHRAEREFSIPSVHDLKRTAEFANDLEERCDRVLKNRYEHSDDGPMFETMQKWRSYAREHLTKFILPNFDRLNKQLDLHQQWIQKLPWYCTEHELPHGKDVLDDVIETTDPKDDIPPSDEFFTCICFVPVRPPSNGEQSDAVQCDHCSARFHGLCAKNGGSCPFCDPHHWNGSIHKNRSWHFCYLPTVLHSAPEVTKSYSQDWKDLETIVRRVDRLSGVIGQFLSSVSESIPALPTSRRLEMIAQVRHYMRKLYQMQFAVSPNPEVSFGLDLAGLHRILAGPLARKKKRRSKFIFGQDVDKDWIDGTRCICRGRTSYLRGYPSVECDSCKRQYHKACVFFEHPGNTNTSPTPYVCPLCALRKGRSYRYADVRVKALIEDKYDDDKFVDIKACLETHSKELIKIRLPKPVTQTLFVELVEFVPAQAEGDQHARPPNPGPSSHNQNGSSYHGSGDPSPVTPQRQNTARNGITSPNVPPPPPWSRPNSRTTSSTSVMALGPDLSSRKRKHNGDDRPRTPDNAPYFGVTPSPKRATPLQPPVHISPPRPGVRLSPSLSKMLVNAQSGATSPLHSPPHQRPNPSPSQRSTSRRSPPHWSPPSPRPPVIDPSLTRPGPPAVTIPAESTTRVPTPVRKVKLLVRDSQHRERDTLQEPVTTAR
ncbi:hypothetical protein BD410DRAFT_736763 [Rickenella mellea]|uniref:[histone H3]-trimethyl-L-lysine(4) demethylase n=1 Tax=Rickenella mellea TaxID=50990 RepID=A0A4R5XGC4_9AGAM|nr:hypothetical protein BD410DRAFT_736763 [Rickenella mellea]